MDAWIDVMDDMVRFDHPMARVCVVRGGTFKIIIEDSKEFRESSMYRNLIDCVKFINEERLNYEYLIVVLE